jgi:hypothetical protein
VCISWLFVGIITYIIAERFLFWPLTNLFPSNSQGVLGYRGYVVLQYSKDQLIPENYIAILGDSYAYGQGEWMVKTGHEIRPDYNTSHLLKKTTGKDTVSFGWPGAGSIRSMVSLPASHIANIRNSLWYDIEDPEIIIVYFYEGNDLDDNLEDLDARFHGRGYDENKLYDKEYFENFLKQEAIINDKYYKKSQGSRFLNSFYLAPFAYAVTNIIATKGFKRKTDYSEWGEGKYNRIIVNGKQRAIGDGSQSPELFLNDDEIELGIYVFDETLSFLSKAYPDSKIGIAYIPSPLTSYQLDTDKVYIESWPKRESFFPASEVEPRSDQICNLVREVAKKQQVAFIDTRERIRKLTETTMAHDPADWQHFNRHGYTALAKDLDLLVQHLLAQPGKQSSITGSCTRLSKDINESELEQEPESNLEG